MSMRVVVSPRYMDCPDIFSIDATVTDTGLLEMKGKSYSWIKLNATIFHPQGGGQLSDTGTIDGVVVDYVHKEKLSETDMNYFEILHCFSLPTEFKPGQIVKLVVDGENRHQNSIWHTSGHVLDYILSTKFPQLSGVSGQHYPHNAFVKFSSKDGTYPGPDEIKGAVKEMFGDLLKRDLAMAIVIEDGVRKLKIADHAVPCGGTHAKNIHELGMLEVRKSTVEKKEDKLKVSYDLVKEER